MLEVNISDTIVKKIKRELRAAGKRETGGILMAEQIKENTFSILDFSVDRIAGTESGFRRHEAEHVRALDTFLEQHNNNYSKYNYLGEWHSHPSFSVQPSLIDMNTMTKMVNRDITVKFAALLIVRLDFWFKLSASATLFNCGHPPAPIKLNYTKNRKARNKH